MAEFTYLGPEGGGGGEQVLDLRRALHAIRRRRFPLVAMALLGLATALIQAAIVGAEYTGRALVLVGNASYDPTGRVERDVRTEVRILTSAEVLARAAATLEKPRTASDLRKHLRAREVTDDLIEVVATAPSAKGAAQLANAVANAYLAQAGEADSTVGQTTLSALEVQRSEFLEHVRRLDEEVAATTAAVSSLPPQSPEALRKAALADSLRAEKAVVTRDLYSLNDRIAEARLQSELARRGTRVVQRADEPTSPTRPRPLRDAVAGAAVGLVVGGLLALGLEQGDRRLRRRDEICAVARAPLLTSMDVSRHDGEAPGADDDWSVAETLALRQAFTRIGMLDEEPPVNVVLVVIAGDRVSPLAALRLGRFAASSRVTAAVVPGDSTVARLLNDAERRSAAGRIAEGLWLADAAGSLLDGRVQRVDLTLTVVRATPAGLRIPTWGRPTRTALVVAAGTATPIQLAAAAEAARAAGHPLRGVIVVDPDPDDLTLGLLDDNLRPVPPEGAVTVPSPERRPEHRPEREPESRPGEPDRSRRRDADPGRAAAEAVNGASPVDVPPRAGDRGGSVAAGSGAAGSGAAGSVAAGSGAAGSGAAGSDGRDHRQGRPAREERRPVAGQVRERLAG